jgi:hypothetical protein
MQRLPLLPLVLICQRLPLAALAALAATCKRLANVVHSTADASLWRARCLSSTPVTIFGANFAWRDLFALERLVLHRALPPRLASASISDASTSAWLLAHVRLAVAPIFAAAPPVLNVALLGAPRLSPQALAAAHVLRTLLDVFPRLVTTVQTNDSADQPSSLPQQQQVFVLAPTRAHTPVQVRVLASHVPLDNVNAPATLVADAAADWADRDAVLFVACGDAPLDTQLTADLLATVDAQLVRRIAVFVPSSIVVDPFKPLMWRATSAHDDAKTRATISVVRSLDALINWIVDDDSDESAVSDEQKSERRRMSRSNSSNIGTIATNDSSASSSPNPRHWHEQQHSSSSTARSHSSSHTQ